MRCARGFIKLAPLEPWPFLLKKVHPLWFTVFQIWHLHFVSFSRSKPFCQLSGYGNPTFAPWHSVAVRGRLSQTPNHPRGPLWSSQKPLLHSERHSQEFTWERSPQVREESQDSSRCVHTWGASIYACRSLLLEVLTCVGETAQNS